jgi:hypothetical protein
MALPVFVGFVDTVETTMDLDKVQGASHVSSSWRWLNETSDTVSWPNNFSAQISSHLIYLTDINNRTYVIEEAGEYNWTRTWTLDRMTVALLFDPDDNYFPNFYGSQFVGEPDQDLFSGDEVLIFCTFYHFRQDLSYSYDFTYTWTDENTSSPVDPNQVLPLLEPEYSWASFMNDSMSGNGAQRLTYIGFDVAEYFLAYRPSLGFGNLPALWQIQIQHEFVGFTVFNDTNGNGIMDLYPKSYSGTRGYSGNLDGYWLNFTRSEFAFQFQITNATVAHITLPRSSSDDQIEWGVLFRTIEGQFLPKESLFDTPQQRFTDLPRDDTESIPAVLDNLRFTCRFNPNTLNLNITQDVGSFLIPSTSSPLPNVSGLSLALTYWNVVPRHTRFEDEDNILSFFQLAETDEVLGDTLHFHKDQIPLGTINYGGQYTLFEDSSNYEVGTVITPEYSFLLLPWSLRSQLPGTSYFVPHYWPGRSSSNYYSACYPDWSGSSFSHSIIFGVVLSAYGYQIDPPLYWTLLLSVVMICLVILWVIVFIRQRRRKMVK